MGLDAASRDHRRPRNCRRSRIGACLTLAVGLLSGGVCQELRRQQFGARFAGLLWLTLRCELLWDVQGCFLLLV